MRRLGDLQKEGGLAGLNLHQIGLGDLHKSEEGLTRGKEDVNMRWNMIAKCTCFADVCITLYENYDAFFPRVDSCVTYCRTAFHSVSWWDLHELKNAFGKHCDIIPQPLPALP